MIILTPDTKKCMSALLLKDTFDSFCFIEGEITTFARFSINGSTQKDFFEEPPSAEYSQWKRFRDFCFSIIKGKQTPLGFRLIFSLAPEDIERFLRQNAPDFRPSDVQGLYLNFRFDGKSLTCTSGTSLHIFTLDRSLEQAWDKYVQNFFYQHGIPADL